MAKRRRSKKTGGDVLDADTVARIAAALVPAELSPADRQLMHERIFERIRTETRPRDSDDGPARPPANPSKA